MQNITNSALETESCFGRLHELLFTVNPNISRDHHKYCTFPHFVSSSNFCSYCFGRRFVRKWMKTHYFNVIELKIAQKLRNHHQKNVNWCEDAVEQHTGVNGIKSKQQLNNFHRVALLLSTPSEIVHMLRLLCSLFLFFCVRSLFRWFCTTKNTLVMLAMVETMNHSFWSCLSDRVDFYHSAQMVEVCALHHFYPFNGSS